MTLAMTVMIAGGALILHQSLCQISRYSLVCAARITAVEGDTRLTWICELPLRDYPLALVFGDFF